jgi:hypothetical protein
MASKNILTTVAAETRSFFEPLFSAFEEPVYFQTFMMQLGWVFSEISQPFQQLANALNDLMSLLEDDDVTADDVTTICEKMTGILSSISNLSSIDASDLPVSVDLNEFRNEFPEQLMQFLLVDYLMSANNKIGTLLKLLGVIRIFRVEASGPRPAYFKREIALNQIGNVLKDPVATFKGAYRWGQPDFKAVEFIDSLFDLGFAYGMNVRAENLSHEISTAVNEGPIDASSIYSEQLKLIILENHVSPENFSIGLGIALLPQNAGQMPGFAILPFNDSGWNQSVQISQTSKLLIELNVDLSGGIAIIVRPGDIKIAIGLLSGFASIPSPNLQLNLGLEHEDSNGELSPLLVISEKTFLAYQKIRAGIGAKVYTDLTPDFFTEVSLSGGKLSIGADGSDGFLQKLLPSTPIEVEFDLALRWSVRNGFHLAGSGGLEVSLPLHFVIGPLSILDAVITLKPAAEKLPIEIGLTVRSSLGPLTVVVDGVGAKANFAFLDDNSGNFGPLDLDIGFKPPRGVGLSLDAGGFKGGGFLMLDHEKGEYAGALELDFKGLFSVKAIGIINTKMPDGSKGFSLLIVITAEFTPIQLSFGFTLNGVGGIFGLNRMINVAALADGIRTNAVKSILFPQDVIANITRIISDIKQFFPPQRDHFVVGPMAKLGWGTPSIITVELGLLLDLPNPMFAIVGVLKAMLPAEDAPLLRLQVNFIGVVDFDRGYIFFRADLFDSRLLVYSITGSMAFLVSWGEAQTFALSVGGFHPDFRDIPSIPALPDGFRNMARIGLSLLSDDNPRIKVESYFAVTSNTVQFGARVELYASAGGFNIYGFLGYDVLFQFDPFRFLANISGGVALRRGSSTIAGINVSATLSGPTPWDARGKASISFFFFSISVGFHVTWGDPPPAISPATEDLLALMQREFNDTRNWRAELPPNNHLHVSLRKIEPPVGQELLVIHPAGVLTFSQRSLPLEDYLIQKFGNKKPLGQNKFKLSNANSGGPDIPADYQGIREQFAPGNFTELTDSEKLSRRSFEKLPSGFKLTATNDLLVATPVTRSVVYELSYLRRKSLVLKGLVSLAVKAYSRLVKGSSVRQSTLAHQQNRLSLNAPRQVTLPEEGFAIASTADLKSHLQNGAGAVVFATQAEAYQRQSELIAQNPSLAGSLQVVSNFELNLN